MDCEFAYFLGCSGQAVQTAVTRIDFKALLEGLQGRLLPEQGIRQERKDAKKKVRISK